MYNKTIIRFGFCDIRNNQGRGNCYLASANNTYRDLDYSGYRKNLIPTSYPGWTQSSFVMDRSRETTCVDGIPP